LEAVTSGLIALAFTGQLSLLGTGFNVFGLVPLPTLAFVGVTAFERALRNGGRGRRDGGPDQPDAPGLLRCGAAGRPVPAAAWPGYPAGDRRAGRGCPARRGISS